MPGSVFSSFVLSESEIGEIADAAVADLAERLAQRAFRPLDGSQRTASSEAAGEEALAMLHVLFHLQRAVAREIDGAAVRAAGEGAGYPQLGQACNMSRQGARRRWPGLVTTGSSADAARSPEDA